MNDVQKTKGANKKSLPLFFSVAFKVISIIVIISCILLYLTFTFEEVPPILNRGIQPATFPKALLILIIVLSLVVYFLSIKKPWQIDKNLPSAFYITLASFVIFLVVGVILDFFLGISILSILVSYFWGERRIFYLFLVAIIFPTIVFIFFETILGLRFPGGIITNLYYN
ncbi:tripartite tricarboxylate transporter TctB family protein [Candidatus Pelagibacter sp.]|uniref:tripartite tricarboxylate transporter TctB family protein n=1 Tax=Candidatus Pelagibacter sp. TaxID=2024849 RepID=UPI003F85A353